MTALRSSLDRHVGRTPTSEEDLRAMARRAWLENGTVVIFPDQYIGWVERQAAENAAAKLYGKRRGGQKR